MREPRGPVSQECIEAYVYTGVPLRLLLLRRPPSRGRIWAPVSGKVDPGDRDFEAAVRREVEEETGLRHTGPLLSLDWEVKFRSPAGAVWRLHAYALDPGHEFTPRLSAEHEAFAWYDAPSAIRALHYADNREAVRRLQRLRGSEGTEATSSAEPGSL